MTPDEAQLAQRLRDGVGILAHVGGQGHLRIAGALADADDARRGVALENGAVLGKGDLARGVLCRLPVGIVRAALHVVNLLAIELERNAQLDQRLDFALSGEDAVARRRDRR